MLGPASLVLRTGGVPTFPAANLKASARHLAFSLHRVGFAVLDLSARPELLAAVREGERLAAEWFAQRPLAKERSAFDARTCTGFLREPYRKELLQLRLGVKPAAPEFMPLCRAMQELAEEALQALLQGMGCETPERFVRGALLRPGEVSGSFLRVIRYEKDSGAEELPGAFRHTDVGYFSLVPVSQVARLRLGFTGRVPVEALLSRSHVVLVPGRMLERLTGAYITAMPHEVPPGPAVRVSLPYVYRGQPRARLNGALLGSPVILESDCMQEVAACVFLREEFRRKQYFLSDTVENTMHRPSKLLFNSTYEKRPQRDVEAREAPEPVDYLMEPCYSQESGTKERYSKKGGGLYP